MTIREINSLIEESQTLKLIAGAYTEISSLRLQRIRTQVLQSRVFFNEILDLYALVRHIAFKKGYRPKVILKTISIILTSNNRFYGHIDTDLVKFFLSSKIEKGEVICIGRGGKEALNANHFTVFNSILFKKDMPDTLELANLVQKVRLNQRVYIYFAQFHSVIKQVPTVIDITQTQSQALKQAKYLEGTFIFEPEVKKILDFFDTQLKQILIGQTFLESELARVGSRLISMDQAEYNADEYIKKNEQLLLNAKRSLDNTRILEMIASINTKETSENPLIYGS